MKLMSANTTLVSRLPQEDWFARGGDRIAYNALGNPVHCHVVGDTNVIEGYPTY